MDGRVLLLIRSSVVLVRKKGEKCRFNVDHSLVACVLQFIITVSIQRTKAVDKRVGT